MTIKEVRPWDGKYAHVKFGDAGSGVVPVYVTYEGTINILDDEWITVTPRSQFGMNVAPYPGDGRVRISEIQLIE
jgi:hypothetical protein